MLPTDGYRFVFEARPLELGAGYHVGQLAVAMFALRIVQVGTEGEDNRSNGQHLGVSR